MYFETFPNSTIWTTLIASETILVMVRDSDQG
jgi:hypothetical protein